MEEKHVLEVETSYAGFWVRFAACFLDGIVLVAFSTLLTVLLGINWNDKTLSYQFLEFIINISYFVVLTVFYGQTLGKMALGIRVIRQDGGPNTWGTILVRETIGKLVSAIIFLIGYVMAAFDSKKRALHDRIANTYVIKD
jgi:uncharacterized RDD family membrane protein YckC